MAKQLVDLYLFDASEQTVAMSEYDPIDLTRLLLIVNVTDNIIIYQFNNPLLGGTVVNSTLTLTYDTTSMSDSDELMIYYDDASAVTPVSLVDQDSENLALISTNQATLESLIDTLQELIQRLDPLAGAIAMVGGQALRTQGVGTFAVSGPLTNAQLTASLIVQSAQNTLSVLTNINNCTWGE